MNEPAPDRRSYDSRGLLILIDILTNGTPDEDDTGRDPTEEEMDAWLESLADDGGEE